MNEECECSTVWNSSSLCIYYKEGLRHCIKGYKLLRPLKACIMYCVVNSGCSFRAGYSPPLGGLAAWLDASCSSKLTSGCAGECEGSSWLSKPPAQIVYQWAMALESLSASKGILPFALGYERPPICCLQCCLEWDAPFKCSEIFSFVDILGASLTNSTCQKRPSPHTYQSNFNDML